jgi:hypothetical protein
VRAASSGGKGFVGSLCSELGEVIQGGGWGQGIPVSGVKELEECVLVFAACGLTVEVNGNFEVFGAEGGG